MTTRTWDDSTVEGCLAELAYQRAAHVEISLAKDREIRGLIKRLHKAEREIVICSAIRLPDGRIVRGHRHGDCIRTAIELIDHRYNIGLEPKPWNASMCRERGFISSRNRYVDREEGLRLQLAAGIPSACPSGYRQRELFSEDLYR